MKFLRFATLILYGSLTLSHAAIAQGIDPNTSFKTAVINDPAFDGIKAFTVTIPSTWHFQGTVIADLGCNLPSPVFRVYSPDGLTEIRLLPSFTWQIQEKSASVWEGLGASHECIYLNGAMTALQFLERYVRSLGPVDVRGTMSIVARYRQQLDQLLSRMNTNQPKDPKARMQATGDAAAVRIETTNGTFTIEQRLRARVVCILWPKAIAGKLGSCSARLDILRAPKGQLDALVNIVDSRNLTTAKNDDVWLSGLVAALRVDRANRFDPYVPNHAAVAMLYRQASDFGLVTEPEGDRKPLHPFVATGGNATSDWADFAIEPKPLSDLDARVYVKSTPHAWHSSSGQCYQTRDPDANPNGVLPDDWTEQGTLATGIPQ